MSKMSELDLILAEFKKCDESLVSISEKLREIFFGSGDADVPAEKPKMAKKKPEKEAAAAQEPEAKTEKQYSFGEVRAVLRGGGGAG